MLTLDISKEETKINDSEKNVKKENARRINELSEQLRNIDDKLLKNKNNKELEIKKFSKTHSKNKKIIAKKVCV